MNGIIENWQPLLSGAGYTLAAAGIGIVVSLFLGTVLGVVAAMRIPVVSQVLMIYTELVRNTPELVQLFWIYLVLPFLGVDLTVFQAVILYLCFNGVAYTSIVVEGGIEAVAPGQYEAAQAVGLPLVRMYSRVIVPQALRPLVPSLVNEIIRVLKNTTLITLISAPDLIYVTERLANLNFAPIAYQLVAAAFYFVVITVLSMVAKRFTSTERAFA